MRVIKVTKARQRLIQEIDLGLCWTILATVHKADNRSKQWVSE